MGSGYALTQIAHGHQVRAVHWDGGGSLLPGAAAASRRPARCMLCSSVYCSARLGSWRQYGPGEQRAQPERAGSASCGPRAPLAASAAGAG